MSRPSRAPAPPALVARPRARLSRSSRPRARLGRRARGAPSPTGATGARGAGSPSRAPEQLEGFENIQHVVFVVQENRSFDHYFGTFPGAEGIPMTQDGKPRVCVPDPVLGTLRRGRTTTPRSCNRADRTGSRTRSTDVNGGQMDGFVRDARRTARTPAPTTATRRRAETTSARSASPT